MLSKVVIFKNAGSGKSTLARELVKQEGLADLDTLGWQRESPTLRCPIPDSNDPKPTHLRLRLRYIKLVQTKSE